MSIKYLFLSLMILGLFSCKVITWKGNPQTLRYKGDSIVMSKDTMYYYYFDPRVAVAENERIYPKHFKIALPQYVKKINIYGSGKFVFTYNNKQKVFIYIKPEKIILDSFNSFKDTCFVYNWKNKNDIDKLDITDNLTDIGTLEDMHYIKHRKTYTIQKGDATIVLYNIPKNRSKIFLEYTKTFTFL